MCIRDRFRVEGGTRTKLLDITSLSTGTWYHIAFLYKAGNISGSKVYLNGVEQSTTDTGTFPSSLSFTGLKTIIGGYYGTANTFDGKLDECAIFNKALTQSEISQVYNNGYAADLTSLSPVSWWRLGEDAYFVGNDITIPNQISGAPNGTGAGTQTSILVANAPGSYASGVGTNLDVVDRKGEAPESSANSQSINMIPGDVHPYIPGYVPAQVNNVASMAFDGVDDYFNTNFDANLIGNAPQSFSMWFKSKSTGIQYKTLMGQYQESSLHGWGIEIGKPSNLDKITWYSRNSTIDRTSYGYALTQDQLELEKYIGYRVSEYRNHKFESGMLENTWNKNILSVGLC